MEEEQIRKILKNLATDKDDCINEHTCLLDTNLEDYSTVQKKIEEENKELHKEIRSLKNLISVLSEMYYNNDRFLCELGRDEDTPHLINDINGNNLIIIPNSSIIHTILCVKLCSLLDNIYKHFDCSDDINDIYEILGQLEDI